MRVQASCTWRMCCQRRCWRQYTVPLLDFLHDPVASTHLLKIAEQLFFRNVLSAYLPPCVCVQAQ